MLNTGRLFIALSCVLVLLFGPLLAHAQAPPTVFISEVAWAGSSLSTADEWVELTNLSDASIDVSGWTLAGAGTSNSTLTFPPGSVIASRATFLVSNYAADNVKSSLAVSAQFVTTSVALSNSTLLLTLADVDGNIIDVAGDGGAPPAGIAKSGGEVSMERVDPAVSGTLKEAWASASDSNGFDAGAPDLGSPGSYPFPVPEIVPSPEPVADTVVTDVIPSEPIADASTTASVVEPADPLLTDTTPTTVDTTSPEVTADTTNAAAPIAEPVVIAAPVPEPAPVVFPPQTLVINEFASDPMSGEKEWVEVMNPNNTVIDLDGWKVSESGGRTFALPAQLLGLGQTAFVAFSSGALNNNGDMITLLDPNGQANDAVTYGAAGAPVASDPNAVARDTDGTFVITTTPTPGEPNIITPIPAAVTVEPAASDPGSVEPISTTTEILADPIEPATVTTPSSTEVISLPSDNGLILSELYPNTTGSDADEEFIEIENRSDQPLDLTGIALADAAGKPTVLDAPRTLDPGEQLAIMRSAFVFALNNSGGETVSLYGPDGSLLDETSYETAPEGFAFARTGDAWDWTPTPTPNEPNLVSQDEPVDTTGGIIAPDTVSDGTVDATEPIVTLTPDEIQDAPLDTPVDTTGTVVATPGTLGTQIMYLDGVQVYKSDADFPDLTIGDEVELTGTTSQNRGESRIKVGKKDFIEVVGQGDVPAPSVVTKIGEDTEGNLVQIEGVVLDKQSDRFTVQTPDAPVLVRAKANADLSFKEETPGTHVNVVGIVSQVDKTYSVLPRSMSDITILQPPAGESDPADTASSKEPSARTKTAIGTFIATATVTGLVSLYVRHRFFTNKMDSSAYEIHELPVPDPT